MAELTHTRISLGSQLRAALDDAESRGWIDGWKLTTEADGRLLYEVRRYCFRSRFTPGEAMDFVNTYGYGVRFGRDPRESGRGLVQVPS